MRARDYSHAPSSAIGLSTAPSSLSGPRADSDLLGSEWLGVDDAQTETSRGARVNGHRVQSLDPLGRALDDLGLIRCAPEHAQAWPVRFSGVGRDYFRIWLVNLLLTVLTLGLFRPWAEARALRYLQAHTWVAGHALVYRGRPHVLPGAGWFALSLLGLGGAMATGWPLAGAGAYALVAALVPLWWWKAWRVRVEQTTWRGLHLDFHGSVAGAYRALALPLVIGALGAAMAASWLASAAGMLTEPMPSGLGEAMRPALAVLAAVFLVGLPYFIWLIKRYQHGYCSLGPLELQWKATPEMLYGLSARVAALSLVPLALVGGLVWSLGEAGPWLRAHPGWAAVAGIGFIVLATAALLGCFGLARPYAQVQLQNLVWSKTGNRYLRLRSTLRLGPYLRLQGRNTLLLLCTLGLYWPWAVVATRRMRLDAVTLISRVVPDDLVASAQRRQAGPAGEELFSLDLGW